MTDERFAEAIEEIVAENPKYAADAYYFVSGALRRAFESRSEKGDSGPRHVTGGELLAAARDLALDEFGPMAMAVMNAWGIEESLDIGKIVFGMVEKGVLSASEEDSLDDFRQGFDLAGELSAPFTPKRRGLKSAVAIDDERRVKTSEPRRDENLPS
jgi:uncharacterized repeat protein (TIGR04138 family)